MTQLTLNDVSPNWAMRGGIFTKLDAYTAIPWANKNIGEYLDMEYYGNISGGKLVAPLIDNMLNGAPALTESMTNKLAHVIMAMYLTNWQKQYDTLSLQYNPINNYDMTETMTDTNSTEYGHVLNHQNSGTVTEQGTTTSSPDVHQVDTIGVIRTDIDAVSGFNSTAYVQAAQSVSTPSGTNKSDTTGSTTDTSTNSVTNTTSFSDTNSGTDTHTVEHELKRSGNIGVTTSQQMIQAERDLWLWNFMKDTVFPDVDKVLVCPMFKRRGRER